jgi:DNA-binding transcriptional ArsR family regulator
LNYGTIEKATVSANLSAMGRPLSHPNMDDVTVAGILYALADPVRLAIVNELLYAECGVSCTETAHRLAMPMPKSTCSQHYRILREAGVIRSERKGVQLTSHVRWRELEARFPGLLRSILEAQQREGGKPRRRPRISRSAAAL